MTRKAVCRGARATSQVPTGDFDAAARDTAVVARIVVGASKTKVIGIAQKDGPASRSGPSFVLVTLSLAGVPPSVPPRPPQPVGWSTPPCCGSHRRT